MVKKKKNIKLLNLQTKVNNNLGKLCDFDCNIELKSVQTKSCYDCNKATLPVQHDFVPNIDNSNEDMPKYKSKIVDMTVNESQHSILQVWLNAYIEMYNEVIKFFVNIKLQENIKNYKSIQEKDKLLFLNAKPLIDERKNLLKQKKKLTTEYDKLLTKKKTKTSKIKIINLINEITNINIKIKNININIDTKNKEYYKHLKIKNNEYYELMNKVDYKNIRTNYLKKIRNEIQLKTSDNSKMRIKIHILDCAIKTACSSYKSCISNYLANNIKNFKVRYWRYNKKTKIMEIEKEFISNGELLQSTFNKFNLKYNKKEYKLTGNETVTLLYNSESKKYYLLVAEKIVLKETKFKKYIGIDQGIKPFIACRTNNELINMGTNIKDKVGKHLKNIDKVRNSKHLNNKKKKKKEKKIYLKIKNMVDETHWKIIKEITSNYGNVIIGNINMKSVVSKKSKLSPELKRIGLMMRLGEFRRRLRYKCLINGVKIEVVDEAYTSKVCSVCGNCKEELKGEKEYECKKCKVKRDRDFNSATNMILLKM